jgi:TRAP-type C4-dicarboxylate transport system substrate-binding protein
MTIRVGGYAPPGSAHSRALDHFAGALATVTDHPVEVVYNVMDDGRPATDLFDMVATGELTWCYFSTSYLGNQVPALNALEVPFLFADLDEAHTALDGDFGAALTTATEAVTPYEVLGYWDNGFRHFTNRLHDVRSPADVAGMRVRLQPNAVHEALIRSWGGEPVPAELSDGIAMIASGQVDAQENPLANSAAYGVDHRHITMTAHLYGARGLYANRSQMSTLGSDGATAVRSAARAAIDFQRRAAANYEAELRARFEGEGRVVLDLAPTERKAFEDAASEVIAAARAGQPALDFL